MYQTNMTDVIEKLESKGFTIDYSEGDYLNIARADGVHCEFYPCGENDDFLTATYSIDGVETEIDVYIRENDGVEEFVGYVENILKNC